MTSVPQQIVQTPRQKRREARIDAILTASMEILVREGLDGLTIGRLADALGYTPGSFYRYFPSKDAILGELQVRVFEQIRALLGDAWRWCDQKTDGMGSSVKLAAAARIYVDLQSGEPIWFGLIGLAMAEPRQLLTGDEIIPVMKTVMGVLGEVEGVLETAVGEGVLDGSQGSRTRAVTLWSSLHGVLMTRKFARFDAETFDARPMALSMAQALFVGWGADRDAIGAAFETVDRVLDGGSLVAAVRGMGL